MIKYFLIAAFALCVVQPAFAADSAEEKAEKKEEVEKMEKKESRIFPIKAGNIEIVALLDRVGEGALDLLIGAAPEDLARAKEPGALATTVNAFIVKMNGKTILFDAGLPKGAGPTIQPALAEAGVKPEDIDAIVITHFHFDHIGGLLDGGKAVFPKAEIFLPQVEIDKWSNPGTEFLMVYGSRSNVFAAGKEIMPGITALAAYGHTPGHTIYRLEKDADRLLMIGDLIHFPGVQLANPDIAVTYDTDPAQAVAARKRFFDQAASEKMPVASMHIPFPGIGVLAKEGKGYSFRKLEK